MKNKILRKRIISYFLIFLIVFILLVNFSSVISAHQNKDILQKHMQKLQPQKVQRRKLLQPVFTSFRDLIESFIKRFFSTDDSSILKPTNYQLNDEKLKIKTNLTVVLPDNKIKTVDMLNKDIKVVKLYNSRLGFKINDFNFTLLPQESTVLSKEDVDVPFDNIILIDIPDAETVIGVEDPIVEVPLASMISNISYQQSIKSLNEYEVSNLFSELSNPDLFENILCYSIDWGDGSPLESYLPNQKEVTHLYKSSDTYLQTIYITDISGEEYQFTNSYTVEYEGHILHTYLFLDEYKEPIATTSAGIGALTLLGIAITETGKYKLLSFLLFLIPMYTRIKKDDLLDNFVRGEIYGLIKGNPGICYTGLMKKLDVKNGTLSYHLHKLEKMEMIRSRREGLRYRAFYPTDMKFPAEERFRLTDLQVNILNTVKQNGGLTQRDIAKKLSKNPQTINYNIKVLRQSELVHLRRQGRKTVCYSP